MEYKELKWSAFNRLQARSFWMARPSADTEISRFLLHTILRQGAQSECVCDGSGNQKLAMKFTR